MRFFFRHFHLVFFGMANKMTRRGIWIMAGTMATVVIKLKCERVLFVFVYAYSLGAGIE